MPNNLRHDKKPDDGPNDRRREKKASALIVDPNPLSLIATAGVLHYHGYACTCGRTVESANQAVASSTFDLLIWDVADDAAAVLAAIAEIRSKSGFDQLPAVLIAESSWAGLEEKTQRLLTPTRSLFKPIDPNALIAVVDQLLWLPSLVSVHRRRGSKPSHSGWITLE